jgi:hypothetical protein
MILCTQRQELFGNVNDAPSAQSFNYYKLAKYNWCKLAKYLYQQDARKLLIFPRYAILVGFTHNLSYKAGIAFL